MKTTTSAKFTVAELARMMGKPAKEVLFLLQGIGVDVKSVESILDPSTAQAILTGKTQAPKTLIVRQTTAVTPVAAAAVAPKPKPERAALKRIKIVERPLDAPAGEGAGVEGVEVTPPAEAAAAAIEVEVAAPLLAEPVSAAEPTVAVEPVPEPAGPVLATAPAPAPEPVPEPALEAPAPQPEVPHRVVAAEPEAVTPQEPAAEALVTAAAPEVTPPAAAEEPTAPEPAPSAVPQAPVSATAAPIAPPSAPVTAQPAAGHPPAARPASRPTPHAPHAAHSAAGTPARPVAQRPLSASGTIRRAVSGLPPSAAGRQPLKATPPPPPAAPKPPLPGGALGRLLKRAGEVPKPIAPPAPAPPPAPQTAAALPAPPRPLAPAAPQSVPHSPLPPRPAPPPAAPSRPGSAAGQAPQVQPAPPRGIQGFGRAVIAPPTASTTRAVAKPQPAPIRPPMAPGGLRPGLPLRPGMPMRPGMPARPGFSGPGRPDMGPRPGGAFGRGPAAPALPPSPPSPGAEKRRKDATKSTVVVKKDDAKKVASKKPRTKEVSALEEDVKVYLGTYQEDTYEDIPAGGTEGEEGATDQPVSKSAQRRAGKKLIKSDSGARVEIKKNAPTGPVFLSEGVTVKELSEKTGILAKDLMKSFLARGILATINHPVDPSLAVEIAKEFGIDAAVVSFEEDLELSRQQAAIEEAERAEAAGAGATAADMVPRAPVVTVMGHVDHGKTSLLDAIRHADVAAGEAGGITQHIGAYRVEVKGRQIVFLDTPGHEAFTMMRARGAKATDIVVLVVAADDGVMPQTLEAIDHARAAKVPMVVAINKIDKPEANPMRVKQALADKGVLVEEYGGEVVSCEISAKKKLGIDNLLEMLALQADLLELKAPLDVPARGVVLEARREVGKGTLATVLVQSGTLKVGDFFFAGAAVGRVRAMLDDRGNRITEAGPATPAEVMGFEDLPNAGDSLQVVENEADARRVQTFRVQKEREEKLVKTTKLSLDSLFNRIEKGEAKELAIIVKADVHGSEEVLVQTLAKLSTDKVKVTVIHSGVGAITLNDVNLAQASEAIIIGFNVRPEKKAEELAGKEGVDIRLYSVIYTLTDEIKKAMAGLLDTVKKEVARGKAEVRALFKIPKIGTIAGCMVTEGVVPRAASVRLVRDSRVIYEGKIGSLKRVKDDASEVKSGFECGIGIAGYQDVKVGDVIEAFVTEEVAASLS